MINIKKIESLADKLTVYFTLSDHNGTYRWHANTPLLEGEELQRYLENDLRETIELDILRRAYDTNSGPDNFPHTWEEDVPDEKDLLIQQLQCELAEIKSSLRTLKGDRTKLFKRVNTLEKA